MQLKHISPRIRPIRFAALAIALCAASFLGACSQSSEPKPSPSVTSSPENQGEWQTGATEADWGTYSIASEDFGNFSANFPSKPSEEVDEEGNLRLIIKGETLTGVQYMLLVEPLDDSEFQALTPMNDQEREGQLQWYAVDFVGAETFVENMQSSPYEGNVGVRYRATNFNAEVWTVLVIDDESGWVYSVCAYSHDDEPTSSEVETTQRFMDSFRLIMT